MTRRSSLLLIKAGLLLCGTALVSVMAVGRVEMDRAAQLAPPVEKLADVTLAAPSVITDDDGNIIRRVSNHYEEPVALEDMPELLVDAFVDTEDQNFWSHDGYDSDGIMRAAFGNLLGSHLAGGSTITQQLLKNQILDSRRTIWRKLQEMALSQQAERRYGKRAILGLYLNTLWLGHGAYGVAAGARTYFGKPLEALSPAEIAYLAALPKGPSNYDPDRHPQAARERRNHVLRRLRRHNHISEAAFERATQEALTARVHHPVTSAGPLSYYEATVRHIYDQEHGGNAIYRDSVTVVTSMKPAVQDVAAQALQQALMNYSESHEAWRGPPGDGEGAIKAPSDSWVLASVERRSDKGKTPYYARLSDGHLVAFDNPWSERMDVALHLKDRIWLRPVDGAWRLAQVPKVSGAVVVMNAQTGDVWAEQGGFDFSSSAFDRARQAVRQPGSAVKPFVYLAAFARGATPETPVLDIPISLKSGDGRWRPGGDGTNGVGLTTIRHALSKSENMAAVRMAQELGLPAVSREFQAFGLYPDDSSDFSVVLGARETSLESLVAAYAAIANGGNPVKPRYIGWMETPGQEVLLSRETLVRPALQDAPYLGMLVSVLRDVVSDGTAAKAFRGVRLPVAGKTGTSNGQKDATFISFCGQTVVGVRIGYDAPMPLHGMAGSLAAPVAASIYQELPKELACMTGQDIVK